MLPGKINGLRVCGCGLLRDRGSNQYLLAFGDLPVAPEKLLSPSEIARRLHVSPILVRSILEGLSDVSPRAFVDNTPVYDRYAAARVLHELNTLEAAEARKGVGR